MAKRLSQNDFIERISEVHGNKYDYTNTVYLNIRTKVDISCKKHGGFQILPDNHLRGQGCFKCIQDNHKLIEISKERLENLKNIHNNKYLYNNLEIIDGQIEVTCQTHGKFEQSIYNHERGHGCNLCNIDNRKIVKYRTCKYCHCVKTKDQYNSNFRTCKNCLENKPNITSKICNKCNLQKSIDEFHLRKDSVDGYRNDCLECFKYEQVPRAKIYRQKNRKSLRQKDTIYRKQRMATDPFYRAKMDARNIIRKALSERGYSKKSRTQEILGCSFIQFKEHIESLFLTNMNWDNRNEWHIDHIIPLSFASNESELLSINHYKNLRPLWIVDNQLKSDSIELQTDLYDKIIKFREISSLET